MKTISILFLLLTPCWLPAQDMADYNGNWEGSLTDRQAFHFSLQIEGLQNETGTLILKTPKELFRIPVEKKADGQLFAFPDDQVAFKGRLSADRKEIRGFLYSGRLMYQISLAQTPEGPYTGTWNPLMVTELLSSKLYLSVENGQGDNYQAYPFLGDHRFTGTWCTDFQKEGAQLRFRDAKTGLQFRGELQGEKIKLVLLWAGRELTSLNLERSTGDWMRGDLETAIDSNLSENINLRNLETAIGNGTLPHVHSVLVARAGETIYERYFAGYHAALPHDQRSASKSVSSTVVGLAKDAGLFSSLEQSIYAFLPPEYQETQDSLKATIDLESLLTMSSGLDADDYAQGGISAASEGNYQSSDDWLKTVLEAPMLRAPNTESWYGSANPYLLGVAMDSIVGEPLEFFMDEKLFRPLGISGYIIQMDDQGRPYFGGGMYLTPRDMVKYGQLYLNEGRWQGEKIISAEWIKASFQNYRRLQNTPNREGYGYLWWHRRYRMAYEITHTVEARGAGGQYIFVVPQLDTVVVITSGNYRNGKTQQPELIFQNYLLPFLLFG